MHQPSSREPSPKSLAVSVRKLAYASLRGSLPVPSRPQRHAQRFENSSSLALCPARKTPHLGDLSPLHNVETITIPIALLTPTPDNRRPRYDRSTSKLLKSCLPPSLITLRLYLQPSLSSPNRDPDPFAWSVEEFTLATDIPERFPQMTLRLPKLGSLSLMGVAADRSFSREAEQELLSRVPTHSDIALILDWDSL